ncbi:four helix bundle suffix domain-containing protein [bacterium]|nr:four helix bundle suffix domain-containing protein [bacterium]
MNEAPKLISVHGGYRNLRSFQCAQLVYDNTVIFCNRLVSKYSRTHDQMVQAARSGVQNIAEASMASGISKKTELKLTGVARASLEELLLDYEDFLRQNSLRLWGKNEEKTLQVRKFLSDLSDPSDKSDLSDKILKKTPEVAANILICLTHQSIYLLRQQLKHLELKFLKEGGFTEKLYQVRSRARHF